MFPYSAVYVHANRAALQHLSDHAYKTLQALITYANEIGICWPGIRLLVNDTGKCKEMVAQALEELAATGCIAFVRRNARDKYTGQRLVNIYQISPVLLHVRPELEAEVAKSWKKAKGKEFALSYSGQDITNTRTSDNSTSDNRKRSIQHQQEASGWSVNMGGEEATIIDEQPVLEQDTPNPGSSKKTSPRQPRQPEMFRAGDTPPNARFQPMKMPYPDISPVPNPLPNKEDEALAQRIRDNAQMPIKLARGLIAQHGRSEVEAAANHPFTPKAHNPAGYIRYLVQGNRLDPERDAKFLSDHEMDVQKYITGEYADLIEH